ncbi:hypothetical protein EJ08DRAFT_600846, partial [Tothia fuscella]
LHPRVAVLLGLNNRWHKWLYLCRMLSVLPEYYFGIPVLWKIFWLSVSDETGWVSLRAGGKESRLLVEMILAAIWCAVCGYIAFFSMDCLMMRWLIKYTPMASIVRLCSASFVYFVGTNFILQYSGSTAHLSILLPAWIFIALALGSIYLAIHERAHIKRQGAHPMRVCGTASFLTMCSLLALLHIQRCSPGN